MEKKWTALYPFCISSWTLIDTYHLARKCTEVQEWQLIKSGRLDEFNNRFYNTVERALIWKLSVKEMADYTGPINFITMVEP